MVLFASEILVSSYLRAHNSEGKPEGDVAGGRGADESSEIRSRPSGSFPLIHPGYSRPPQCQQVTGVQLSCVAGYSQLLPMKAFLHSLT